MIYSEMIKRAMNLAYKAHLGRLDKNGYPYIAHPLHLAETMKDEKSTIVALLHDVVEDTDVTFSDIEVLGFDKEVIVALRILTHDKNVDYMDYIKSIKSNTLAKVVKIADLKHNSDLSRLAKVNSKDLDRAEKYKKALEFLES